jgi:hypothetical protein
MARIQQYSTDTTITGGDKLVGNDASSNLTKLFQISDIAAFFAKEGIADGAKIGYQFNYGGKYNSNAIASGNIEYDVNPTAPAQFTWANIDKIAVSTNSANSADISNVLPFMVNQNIKVTDILNDTVDNFAVFNVSAIADITGGKLLTVALKASSGTPTAANIVLAPFGFVSASDINALTPDDIIDDLLSTDATKVLSANQGRILKNLIDVINSKLVSDDPSLDTLQEIVDYIKNNSTNISALQSGKVDKVAGKQLSTEDFTSVLLAKLNSIATNAEVNVQADWAESNIASDAFIQNKPTDLTTLNTHNVTELSDVTSAGSGEIITSVERTKLNGIAEGAEVNVQANWNETDNTSDAYIANKPTVEIAGTTNEVEITPTGAQNLSGAASWTVGLPNDVTITDNLTVGDTLQITTPQSSTPTFDNGLYISQDGTHDTLHFRYDGHDLSIDKLTEVLPSGVLNGGELSTTPGSTTFTIAAGNGIINDLNKAPGSEPHPEIVNVSWTSQTITVFNLNGSSTEQLNAWVYIDSTGTVQQQAGAFTEAQFRTNIPIGSIIHTSGTTQFARTFPRTAYNSMAQHAEFIASFGPLKKSGHNITANGANLSLDRAAGVAFALGRNYATDPENPSTISDSSRAAALIHRYYSDGSNGFTKDNNSGAGYTGIDPTKYDDGTGTLANVPGGSYTAQRLFYFPGTPSILIAYYGKATYANLDTAQRNYLLESFTEADNTSQQAIYVGVVLVKSGATALNNSADAKILIAGQFRSLAATNLGGVAANALIGDLGDVNITSVANNQILQYNSSTTRWENQNISLTTDLDSLTDVTLTSPSNGQVIKYNTSTSQWENAADAGGIALTDLSMATPAAASGSGDVSYNNTTGEFTYTPPNLSSYIDGTGSANKIAFWTDADTLSNDTNLHWDAVNDRLGIGTTSPSNPLHVYNATVDTVAKFESGDASVAISLEASDNTAVLTTSGTDFLVKNDGSGNLRFFNNNSERMRVDSNGNVGIGTTSPSVSLDINDTDAIKIPNGTTVQRPTAAAGMLRYNTTDGQFEGYTTSWGPIGGGGGASVVERDTFSGNGSTTGFTLSTAVSDEINTQVYIDGVYQSKLNYSTSGTTLTFSSAPPAGTNNIEVIHLTSLSVDGASTINKNTFTGDGNTTGFTLSATPTSGDFTFVFIQGVYQEKSTYVVANNVLTFSTAPQNGYTIEVMHVSAVNVQQTSYLEYDAFTGDGNTTGFTLVNGSPTDEKFTMVFMQGVYQEKSTYSLSGSTITFSTAPSNGDTIEIMSINGGGVSVNPTIRPAVNVISTNTTAVANSLYVLTASLTLTLPASPVVGDSIKISNRSGTTTCVLGANNKKIMGAAANLTLDTASASFELIYSGAAEGWVIIGQ